MTNKSWYENAVIYALDVETFNDSTGDGVGDFRGLIDRLDYLNRLGVSALWVLPCYPTPNRDNGYDVTDYYGIDPRLGTLGDFVEFVDEADQRGIKIILDLVVNHTSDQHPWFQESKTDPDSKYRDYYIWVDELPPPESDEESIFPGEVQNARVWSFDSQAGAYYYHRFYPFQPDLNTANPAVREEIYKIMKFWLRLGVDGFRVDAATLMIQPKHPEADELDDPHELLRSIKAKAIGGREHAVLLAEADDDPDELRRYAGDDGMDLLMNFVLNGYLFAALGKQEAAPLIEGIEQLPKLEAGQWANFLRNYDELNLGRLPDDLLQEVFDIFAPASEMRIYGRGIRRRLAPMLDGDIERIKLSFSLLFSLPGTPMILYGDEIGMGEDLTLPGRDAVRTPMQWSDEPNAGFTTADQHGLVAPIITQGEFSYEKINVAAQRSEDDSLLNWIPRLISTRRECHEISAGTFSVVATEPANIIAHRYDSADSIICCVHNLSGEETPVALDLGISAEEPIHLLFGMVADQRRKNGHVELTLDGYGFAWYHITPDRAGDST